MTFKKMVLSLAAFAAMAVILAGCQGKGKAGAGSQKVKVARGDISLTVQSTGNVAPLNKVSILPPVSGRIDKILVLEGAYVKQGQILAWMSSSDRAALLDNARAKGADELKYWQNEYKATPIVAPSTGLIISRNVVEGQTVAGDTDLYDLSDRLVVLAVVDETDLGKITMNQHADITVDAYPSKVFDGRVVLIGHQAIKVNNVVSYQVQVNPVKVPGDLRAGMTANINFILQKKQDVLVLPNWAVKGQQDGFAALKVQGDKNGKIEDRNVRLGLSDGQQVEVLDGLKEGETVLVGSLNLSSGPSGGMFNMARPAATGGQGGGGGGGSRGGGGR